MPEEGIDLLISALRVNRKMREDFVKNPSNRLSIIKNGYLSQQFDISDDEIARMLSIEASSLPDFARKFTGRGTERS